MSSNPPAPPPAPVPVGTVTTTVTAPAGTDPSITGAAADAAIAAAETDAKNEATVIEGDVTATVKTDTQAIKTDASIGLQKIDSEVHGFVERIEAKIQALSARVHAAVDRDLDELRAMLGTKLGAAATTTPVVAAPAPARAEYLPKVGDE